MENEKSLKSCEEKIIPSCDIALSRARLAKASGLRADVKQICGHDK